MAEPEINPVLLPAVEAITRGMAEAFDRVWQREDAPRIVERFLDSRYAFVVTRDGITLLDQDDEP